ncbi:MAG: glycoside hydrolase family 66 protein [Clostridia bacterium]|nr:glycoside hydrolase family 66 protein [Clostridia bacterium]
MNKILRCFCALALLVLFAGARSAKGDETMVCRTEKSMYAPGETAVVCLENLPAEATALRARLYSLERCVWDWQLPASKRFPLSLPDADGRGYALEVEALDEQQNVLTSAFTAVDVSSSWTKFPRYGYVWDFTPSADAESKADEMARYHLNGVQFYDWQYRHHRPLAADLSGWRDWSGRWISGDTVRAYLRAAHDRGMACMAYNMIYAANETYLTDGSGVQADWRLVRTNGADFTCDMDAKLGPVGVLQYFNLLNPDWQSYIFAQENRVFEAFDFDGWHGDTIGENGPMRTADGGPLGYDADGKPIYLVKDGYTAFLNAAKAAIGDKYLAFNPVGAQGIENVNVSAVDVLYTEFWPWDRNANGRLYDDYYTLHRAILGACEQSGGKSLIVAAYVNYRNPKAAFNPASVRMLDCVVFASGGSRIELGNGGNMLSDEYFPADGKKRMDDGLRSAVGRLYDFLVAYENLLRDGQQPVSRTVRLENLPVSTDGRSDTVWCFAKADSSTEIYHFLNLTGTDDGWRDEEQTKKPPIAHENVKTRLYTDYPVREVWLASPDGESPLPLPLEFQTGRDANGAYAEFTQPALEYWNLIFLR